MKTPGVIIPISRLNLDRKTTFCFSSIREIKPKHETKEKCIKHEKRLILRKKFLIYFSILQRNIADDIYHAENIIIDVNGRLYASNGLEVFMLRKTMHLYFYFLLLIFLHITWI